MFVLNAPLWLLRCEGFLKRVSCFYRCSPDAARWPHPHRRSYIQAVPLCHSFCRDWWACQTHYQANLNQNQYLSHFTYKAVKWEITSQCNNGMSTHTKIESPIKSRNLYDTGKTNYTCRHPGDPSKMTNSFMKNVVERLIETEVLLL